MRFGLLGPVVVGTDAEMIWISGSHVSGMLASLLLRANSMVPHAELAADLWCRPPSSAEDYLLKFAMRLRSRSWASAPPRFAVAGMSCAPRPRRWSGTAAARRRSQAGSGMP